MDLVNTAKEFLAIDDQIHSRPENTSWNKMVKMAHKYTVARKNLQIAIRDVPHQADSADGDSESLIEIDEDGKPSAPLNIKRDPGR